MSLYSKRLFEKLCKRHETYYGKLTEYQKNRLLREAEELEEEEDRENENSKSPKR
jgi:hypothetical protein